MFNTLLLLCLCSASMAQHNITCDSSFKHGIYFEPSSDNVRGRYTLKWCITRSVTASCWKATISYAANGNTSSCNEKNLRFGMLHSIFTESIQSNCTNICLAKAVDLVFNASCYHIKTTLGTQDLTSKGYSLYKITHSNNSYHYVADSYPKHLFTESKTTVNYQNDGDDVIIDWYLGFVPVTDYRVKFFVKGKVAEVPYSCSALDLQQSHVRCRARLHAGCYNTTFRHYKPRMSGFDAIMGPFRYTFCHARSTNYLRAPSELRAERTERWWALGGALALLLLGALLFGVRRARVKLELRRCTLRQWLAGDKCVPSSPAAGARAGRVLLLYARDSAHMSHAAQLLAGLLRHCTSYEVVDLYSPETVSAAAPAGGEWLRALLAGADTRVLLLQTPATGLYCARLAPSASGSPALEAPLLSQQVAWRCPHAADPLLLLALRLLTETAYAEPLPYKKYYVASIAGVQHYEAVPAVTPLRRYLLPHAAHHLLEHIAAPEASPPSAPPADPPTIVENPDSLLSSPDSCFTAPQSYIVAPDSPPSIHEAPPSIPEAPPSVSEAPPLALKTSPSALASSPSTTGASPSALESSPSTPGTPLPAQEALSADPERSRLLSQLWSTLEEFRRYAMANPNYLFANLVCE